MSSIRLATFNCENLFARYRFKSGFDPLESDGFTINNLAFDILDATEKRLTAQAIAAVKADIIALQEVENLLLLDRFHAQMLQGRLYRHRLLIDGNDQRNIDVAVLSRFPIVAVRSHRQERNAQNNAALFSRDCLEVEIDVEGRPLTLFVNHFKSMMEGRKETRARRVEQAERVAAIVAERCGPGFEGNFAVLGDLNDHPQAADGTTTALDALLGNPALVDPLSRLPARDRWTHWYKGGRRGERARQLDYILLGKALDQRAGSPAAGIERRGLPWRAEEDYDGPRFDGIGQDDPKASDHCPIYVDIPLAALAPQAAARVAGIRTPRRPTRPA